MEFGILIGLVLFFLGILSGLPLCWVFLGSSAVALILIDSPLTFMAGTAYAAIESYILMAIAFFIFAGGLMSEAGLADRFILEAVIQGRTGTGRPRLEPFTRRLLNVLNHPPQKAERGERRFLGSAGFALLCPLLRFNLLSADPDRAFFGFYCLVTFCFV